VVSQVAKVEANEMATPDEIYELRKTAIGHLEAALRITETVGDEASGFLIERALDQMRADTWPDRMQLPH